MEENKLFHNRYFLERLLGRGNFSEVWLAKDNKTDIQVALKIYAPATGLDDTGLNVFAREFALVVNANHKNLLKPLYYDSYERKPYLVLPYCKNGSIMKHIGQFSEKQTWCMLRDIASGLSWLHNLTPPIIHQDIKPDNIMIGDNDNYLISDFGVSTHLKSTLRKSISSAFSSAGTIAYMAPERFSEDNTPIMANDIYSLGATAYEMLTGDTPFGDEGGLLQKRGADIPTPKGNYSNQLKTVIKLCLSEKPWERPTAEQLVKYTEMALSGKKIVFHSLKKRKSFFSKIGIISIIVMIVTIGGTIMMLWNRPKQEEPRSEDSIVSSNNVDTVDLTIVKDSEITEETAYDSLFNLGIIQQEEMNILAQNNAIALFKEAMQNCASEDKKQLCEQHIKISQSIISKLSTNQQQKTSIRNEMKEIPVEEEIEKKDNPQIPVPEIELRLNTSTLKFKGKTEKTQSVSVICNSSEWQVSSFPDWVKYSIHDNTITIRVDKNTTKEERTGTMIIRCGEKRTTLKIVQARIKALGIL